MQTAPQTKTPQSRHGPGIQSDDNLSLIINGFALDVPPVDLTSHQRLWLKNNNEFSLGVDPSLPPFEFVDDQGTYSGIGSGYVELIASRLKITLTPKPSLTWFEVIEKAKSGDVDILPAVVRTPAREKFLNFTKPYISFPIVITTRKDAPYIDSLAGLAGKNIGVIKGNVVQELIEANHKDIIIVTVINLSQGLRQLNDGKLDAYVGDLLTVTHEIDQSDLNDLKIASSTKYNLELSMGVRKDLPELLPILDKALETISERERAAIVNSWTAIQVQLGMDIKTILTWAVPIGSAAAIVILVVVVWNRKMGREIDQRKKAQAELGEALGHIEDSINYASRIQRSVLPDETLFSSIFKDYFIFWEPRDVVGGDIYWAQKWGKGTIVVLGDCTGHGVPGALMTLITTGAMDRALIDTKEGNVGEFLQHIHQMVQVTLGQHSQDGESDDGMELGVCYFTPEVNTMHFSSARFDLFLVENGEITVIKPTKSGIGYRGIPFDQEFTEHRIDLKGGQTIYMTSDGLTDQVGGDRGRMFGKKRFKKLLADVQDISMSDQKVAIHHALIEYQGSENRRDDVAVMGFKF